MTRRWGAGFVVAAALLSTGVLGVPAAVAQRAPDSVDISIVRVSPSTPAPSSTRKPLTVQLSLHNVTDTALHDIQIVGQRGYPLDTQTALDKSLAAPDNAPISTTEPLTIAPTRPVTVDIPAGEIVRATFSTTTSVNNPGMGLCLCRNAVYPLYFTAQDPSSGTILGSVRTYLPSFDEAHRRLQVSWVWPLIDRPHRLSDRSEFLDDSLTGLVDGGRLDNSLRVIEEVGPTVPMTLIIDPELLDELEVMATGKYTVLTSTGKPVPGTGQQAAIDWLGRLAKVLRTDPVSVDLTPYADPDVQSLRHAGVGWHVGLPADMVANVRKALAGRSIHRDISWPSTGGVGTQTLDTLTAAGTRTVILRNTAVSPSTAAGSPAALARLRTADGPVNAALTSTAMQHYVSAAVSLGGSGETVLPKLVAELAVRVDARPTASGFAVLTPPRYVDANPRVAKRVIEETSRSAFTRPVALRDAVIGDALPSSRSSVRAFHDYARGLAPKMLNHVKQVAGELTGIRSLLSSSSAASGLVNRLSEGLQRTTSAAFSTDSPVAGASSGGRFARRLQTVVGSLLGGVHIVIRSGNYTLTSNRSLLPVTVDNTLDYVVAVRVELQAVGRLPGFTSPGLTQLIQPNSKQQLKVPTQVQRSGRYRVEAQLYTPNGAALGQPIPLSVHSTALGTIGVVITIVAGVVLVVALLVRYIRRIHRLRRKRGTTRTPVKRPPAESGARA